MILADHAATHLLNAFLDPVVQVVVGVDVFGSCRHDESIHEWSSVQGGWQSRWAGWFDRGWCVFEVGTRASPRGDEWYLINPSLWARADVIYPPRSPCRNSPCRVLQDVTDPRTDGIRHGLSAVLSLAVGALARRRSLTRYTCYVVLTFATSQGTGSQ